MLGTALAGRLLFRSLRLTSLASSTSTTTSLARWQPLVQRGPLQYATTRLFSSELRLRNQATALQPESAEAPQELTRFDELAKHGIVSKVVIDTIVDRMGIHTMTDVQRLTINECLDGTDVIAQARTGTGKTLAFLMPIVQRILKDPSLEQRGRYAPRANASDIRALIISPTRELAEQIAVEAKKIVQNTSVVVQTAVGGTQKSFHLRQIQQRGCHILVGTPGRVKDILQDRYSGVKLDNIETFVLDEADRLLDIGFAPDIEEIQDTMPDRATHPRQTLMFSATVPKEVVSLVRKTLRPDFKFIRTVDPDEAPTHASVPQKVVFLRGLQNQMPAILELAVTSMEAHKRDPANNLPFKAIVYFGSTNEVGMAHQVMESLREPGQTGQSRNMFAAHPLAPCKVLMMSSKLTQNERTRNSEGFRNAESAILLSSDVTARGMDFPNVSHVIQIGLPKSSDDYVHRLGRTGRAGKSGQGWLLLNHDERSEYRKKLGHSGIKIDEETSMHTAALDMTQGAQLPAHIARILQMVEAGIKTVPFGMKAQTYTSLLGVLSQQNPSRSKQTIIDLMNDLARFGWGLERPPGISRALISKLGFGRCTGIEIDQRERDDFGGRDRDRGGRSGSSMRRGDGYDPRDPFGKGVIGTQSSIGAGEAREGSFGGGRGSFGSRDFDNDGPRQSFRDRDDKRSSFNRRDARSGGSRGGRDDYGGGRRDFGGGRRDFEGSRGGGRQGRPDPFSS